VERVHNVYKYYYDLNFIDEVLSRKLRMKNLTHRVTVMGIATEVDERKASFSLQCRNTTSRGNAHSGYQFPAIRYFDHPTLTFCWGNYGSKLQQRALAMGVATSRSRVGECTRICPISFSRAVLGQGHEGCHSRKGRLLPGFMDIGAFSRPSEGPPCYLSDRGYGRYPQLRGRGSVR